MEFPSDDNLQSCRQAKSVFFSVYIDIYIYMFNHGQVKIFLHHACVKTLIFDSSCIRPAFLINVKRLYLVFPLAEDVLHRLTAIIKNIVIL